MTGGVLRVLCVDDHAFLAEGLRSKLALESDLEFAGWLPDATGLVRAVRERRAGIVTLDLDMPGPDPFEALDDLRRRCPEARAIVLSAYVRDTYLDAAVEAGAWGYLSKGDDPDEIVSALRRVARGEFVLGSSVQERCSFGEELRRRRRARPSSRSRLLTARERQVLRMIGRGLTRSQIAQELHRSAKTVDAHHQSIMKKLHIHDRVDLVRYAIREGLVEP